MNHTASEIRGYYAPVENNPLRQAELIKEWSIEFFGDPDNDAHYWLNKSIPEIHERIYEHLSSDYQFYYVTAPRGMGKSTIVQLIYIMYRIVYNLEPYILLIEKNRQAANRVLSNIVYELKHNSKLRSVYGNLIPPIARGSDYKFTQEEIRLLNGTLIRCIGMLGDARGALDRMYRFTLIMGNDTQDIKTMGEPTTMQKHIEFWERDVEPAIDSMIGKVRLVGNMLDRGCLLDYIRQNRKYEGINFSALVNDEGKPDLDGHSVWEEQFPTKKLKEEYINLKARGREKVFMAERMNIIVDEGEKNIRGYKYDDVEFYHDDLFDQNIIHSNRYNADIPVYTYACIDPAYGRAKENDPMAMVTIALGKIPLFAENNKMRLVNGVWVLHYNYGYYDPTKLIDLALDHHVKYHYKGLIMETNGPQKIYEYIGERALSENEYLINNPIKFLPVSHLGRSKEDRILDQLGPLCSLGYYHIRPNMTELEKEHDLFLNNPAGLHITDAISTGLKLATVCNEEVRTYKHLNAEYRKRKAMEKYEDSQLLNLNSPVETFRSLGIM